MAMTINVKVTSPGACSGPCALYTDADNYTLPIATGVSITVLSSIIGYNITLPPSAVGATTIRIQNSSFDCSNFVDVPITT